MEHVAGRAEALSKDKIPDLHRRPEHVKQKVSTRKFILQTERMLARSVQSNGKFVNQQSKSWAKRKYRKLIQEVDFWTYSRMDIDKMVDKRVTEIQERLDALRQEEEATQRRTTRSQAGTSTDPTDETEPVPGIGSPW